MHSLEKLINGTIPEFNDHMKSVCCCWMGELLLPCTHSHLSPPHPLLLHGLTNLLAAGEWDVLLLCVCPVISWPFLLSGAPLQSDRGNVSAQGIFLGPFSTHDLFSPHRPPPRRQGLCSHFWFGSFNLLVLLRVLGPCSSSPCWRPLRLGLWSYFTFPPCGRGYVAIHLFPRQRCVQGGAKGAPPRQFVVCNEHYCSECIDPHTCGYSTVYWRYDTSLVLMWNPQFSSCAMCMVRKDYDSFCCAWGAFSGAGYNRGYSRDS